ncbi:hypothetical protein CIN_11760 [Commensalibacter intestini A911]|uniref:Uncharacterized protein n=1 Tax=Commensalibacter intestini A911 TaxID=1088868 RepID=G6F123_9PROT|nr:hypothetical protein CIN_11760 [Commensalibacter intestini A911]
MIFQRIIGFLQKNNPLKMMGRYALPLLAQIKSLILSTLHFEVFV